MTVNKSGSWAESLANSSSPCGHDMTSWEKRMDQLYTYFYLLLFVPGLLLNTIALWVLCRHISKKTKAVIFMINLALADLAHVLSLPLRIFYYFTHTWPFGHGVCMFCFYLKYLNMYASIAFLVCISVQRCVFLLNPFSARRWRRRYDLLISIIVWVVVGLGCSPFILMRSSNTTSTGVSVRASTNQNMIYSLDSTQGPIGLGLSPLYTSPSYRPVSSPNPPKVGCFKDLPTRRLPVPVAVTMMVLAELFGFMLPLAAISYSSIRIARSLNQRQSQDQQSSQAPLSPSARSRRRFPSGASSVCQADKPPDKQTNGDKRRALRMVLSCSGLFLLCFAPYHLNFLLYLMVSQGVVSHCATRLAVRQFHPVSLCLASLSCCLNPLLYYFLTAEFRSHLSRRTSSFTSSLISSPVSTSSRRTAQQRLMSMESISSYRE
ncbi:putative P2Y purinoceptor 10 [Centroberyx gerrardi]